MGRGGGGPPGDKEDVVRVTGDVKALKVVRGGAQGWPRPLTQRDAPRANPCDRSDRAGRARRTRSADLRRMTQLAEQFGRIEAAAKEPAVKLAGLTERLDRIERQIASGAAAGASASTPGPVSAAPAPAPTPEPPPAAPEPALRTASVEPKAKDVPLEGWVLHEVYDGVALIEGRNRRLSRLAPARGARRRSRRGNREARQTLGRRHGKRRDRRRALDAERRPGAAARPMADPRLPAWTRRPRARWDHGPKTRR